MIREVRHEEIPMCVEVIKKSFINLAVLPEYKHKGIGKQLLEHAFNKAKEAGCKVVNIGIVEENKVLRKWYELNGAIHIGTKKYDFFPFTCGYLKKELL